MDYKEELQRIKEVLNAMSMEEFEKMMFDCGFGTILPSGESEFVKGGLLTLREFILTYINSCTEIHIVRANNTTYLIPSEDKRTELKLYEEGHFFKSIPIDKSLENYLLGLTKFKIRPEGVALFVSVIED